MATKIIPKKSSVVGKTPLTSDLDIGEVAINLADKKIFTKDAAGDILQLGNTEEARIPIRADVALVKGDLVYATGAVGTSGKITVNKFIANNTIEELAVIGLAERDLAINESGFAITFGEINRLDTTGDAVSETWVEGTILYASPTTAGKLTYVKPEAPNQNISVAIVIRAHATTGIIFVKPITGFHLGELHDLHVPNPTEGQVLAWDNANERWEAKSSGAGTVTSVAASGGTGISITGSPITTSGTITVTNTAPNVTTNLSTTYNASTIIVNSSDGTNATVNAATTSLAGVLSSTDKNKLDGIATGAQVNVATNLGITGTGNTRTITSSTGTNVTVPVATTTTAGWLSTSDKTKLDGIETGATADQTKADIDALNINADTVDGLHASAFATAAQGTLADTATQPGDNISSLTNDSGFTTNIGDITGVTAGSGITGGGTSGTVTINHADTSTQASVNNTGRTYIQDITLDGFGHITGITSAIETVVNTDTTYTAGTGLALVGAEFQNTDPDQTVGITGGANVTVTGSYPNFTISSTDTNTQLSTEQVQDIVGGMFSLNSESGINVVYQDIDGTIDLNVNDPVITLSGDVSGSATMTNLGNVTITATVADDSHNHIISNVDGLQAALDSKVDDSQVLTNVPAGAVFTDTVYSKPLSEPVSYISGLQAALDSKTTESYVNTQISNLVDTAPATLDTLNELAAALGDDPNFATTVSTSIGTKLNSSAYTAADVLAKVKTVDGAGSGLDADLLDGNHASAFYLASNPSGYTTKTGTVTSVGGTGSVSGLTLTGTVTGAGNLTLGGAITGFATTSHNHTLDSLSNTTITTNSSGEILKWNGTAWVNNTLAEAGIQPSGSYAGASHTHTAANITNFDTEVANNTAVAANTAKLSNATHTGDVTGSTALTIAANAVNATKLNVVGNGTTSQYLRSDGDGSFTWATPPDTNTTYSAGTGLSLSSTTFNNTAPDQTVTLTQGGATTIAGTYPNFTISSTDTNTTYSVGNGGLTEINFTSTLNSKLTGIEAGATADQTAAEILTAIKTVDGAGSGLDADLLDGISSTSFVRSDANDSKTGNLVMADGATNYIALGTSSDFRMWHDGVGTYFRNYNHPGGDMIWQTEGTGGVVHTAMIINGDTTAPNVELYYDSAKKIETTSTGVTVTGTVNGRNVTTDGTKLDGIQAGAQVNVATNLGYTTAASTGTVTSSTGTNVTVPEATATLAGLLTGADKTKLNSIATGAQVNVATNLGITGTGNTRTITSSTGSNVTVPVATASNAGLMATGDKSKLDGITATAAELNILDGVTATAAQLNFVTGVTSAIQTQLGTKAPLASPALTGNPTAPTQIAGNNSTRLATTAYTDAAVAPLSGRNLIINGSGRIEQRSYASGAATAVANQFTLDRWFVVTSGQNLTFTGNNSGRTMTAPAGGVSQVIEGANIVGGTYVINWTGTATAKVNGVSRAKGATFTLTANTNAKLIFSSGTYTDVQIELGTIATAFERMDYGVELIKCQRYFESIDWVITSDGAAGTYQNIGSWLVRKRVEPTITSTSGVFLAVAANCFRQTTNTAFGGVIITGSAELTA
jgi:hypothetical protein